MDCSETQQQGSTNNCSEEGSTTSVHRTVDEMFNVLDLNDPKDRLLNMLDQVEARVDRMRKDIARIEGEQDSLLVALDAIKYSEWMFYLNELDREDVQRSLEKVLDRCSTVEARVYTLRDAEQEEALSQVTKYIDSLIKSIKEDPISAHTRCQTYINACNSHLQLPDSSKNSVSVDVHFEKAVLGCTVDDQKKVRKRLQELLDDFAHHDSQNTILCTK